MYVDKLLKFVNCKELKKLNGKMKQGNYGLKLKIQITDGNRKPDGRYVATNPAKANNTTYLN